MRVFRIQKTKNTFRTIYCPNASEKRACREWLPHLERALEALPPHVLDSIHGFRHGRSAVTNAAAHRCRAHTVSFDISSFFDSITQSQVNEVVWSVPAGNRPDPTCLTVDGAPRQGLPSSPAIANLVGARIDADILERLVGDFTAVYTRYADDMTISSNHQATIDEMLAAVPAIVAAHGFKIAEHKTHVQHASAGRRIITGVGVDSEVHPTRRMKRKLRAARHQKNTPQAAGLSEWCKTRLPKQYTSDIAKVFRELAELLKSK